jgi:predicted tellurium resistance membrane protein TerC|tara:strand:+ start:3700 stop:4407 length:708 start_codon:yes stop_codon:yes gene_type:complete
MAIVLALLTLTLLEVVLGIDNIIFISIVSNRLPEDEQPRARLIGLILALVIRIAFLSAISWVLSFSEPLFSVFDHAVSIRDIILIAGGLFLISKSTSEIHHKMEGDAEGEKGESKKSSFVKVVTQIVLLDIIFSLDSILTAVGMTDNLPIMITAVIISMILMMLFSGKISRFINDHPTLQVLALSFLILIGFMLAVEGVHVEVPKGYIYFAVFFSLIVEVLNLRVMKKAKVKKNS